MSAAATGVAVAVIAGLALTLTHQAPRAALTPRAAIRTALRSPEVRRVLARIHWDSATASAVDGRIERASFFAHGRIVADAAFEPNGHVLQANDFEHQRVPYGNWLAYQPAVLIGLSALFVFMTGVAPLRRLRNLDVAATLTLLAPVVLLQERYVGLSVIAALPGLGYLSGRCACIALGPVRASPPTVALYDVITSGWEARQRTAVLRLLLGALVLTFVMVGVSSADQVDVVYGVMEGATKLLHGVLPYGHAVGDVIHGDTYPLLSYVLYAPVAWAAPVYSVWDSVDLALAATVAVGVATAWMLFRGTAGPGPAPGVPRSPAARDAGLRAALAWLAFPPLLIAVSSGTTDVPLATLLVAAVLLWRRPALATGLLTAGAWMKLAPLLLMPIFLSPLRGRRLAAALVAVAAVSLPLLGVLLVLGGPQGPMAMIRSLSFQFSRGSPQSLWVALGIAGLQPLGEACVLGLVAGAALRIRREPALAEDRGRLAALAAACLIALQLTADYWAFLYVIWVVPLLCLSLFARTDAAPQSVSERASTEVSRLHGVLTG